MRYLSFDVSDDADGVVTLEAMASTAAAQHPEVLAEAEQVLAWAQRHFPHGRGPIDEGMDWDDDLQVVHEAGGWHTVTLTLAASPAFAERFLSAFGDPGG